MSKITLKETTKNNIGTYKQVLQNKTYGLKDFLDNDTLSIVQKYKNMFELKEKIDRINIEYHKIGITELKGNLKNKYDLYIDTGLQIHYDEYMHDLFYDMGM